MESYWCCYCDGQWEGMREVSNDSIRWGHVDVAYMVAWEFLAFLASRKNYLLLKHFLEVSWSFMEFHGVSWSFMEFHEVSWNFRGFWKRWNFKPLSRCRCLLPTSPSYPLIIISNIRHPSTEFYVNDTNRCILHKEDSSNNHAAYISFDQATRRQHQGLVWNW
jgi:hypothetical protein